MNRREFIAGSLLTALAAPAVGSGAPAAPVPAPVPANANAAERPVLNIVYLIPSDMEPCPDWERRLNELLTGIRDFYDSELKRNGSPARLRMPEDPETGRIVPELFRASRPAKDFPYNRGWKAAISEVKAFYRKYPDRKRSDRFLVILPRTPYGVPFYGFGNYCFALDFPGFDIKGLKKRRDEARAAGKRFSPWYGGMAHELGHGLGLPHNHATVSDEKRFGMALMSAGNRTLGLEPTFLTPASCALLESCPVCRVFTPVPFVSGRRKLTLHTDTEGRSVRIRGQLPKGCSVRRIVAAYDKDTFGGVADNYDAEAFVVPFDMNGCFDFVFPLSEIHPGRTDAFQIQLRLAHADANGTIELIRETIVPQKPANDKKPANAKKSANGQKP